MEVRPFLDDLGIIICVAACTTVVFRRFRQPVVLGYILAGLIVGPHVPIPVFADLERAHSLAELGVILVMFSVGLEFNVRKLVRVIPTSGIIGLVQISTMLSLGYFCGRLFGWPVVESMVLGAVVAVSSTMIVAKAFGESPVPADVSETVLGVLVVQDVAAILMLAALGAVSGSGDLPLSDLVATAGRLVGFLITIAVGGFWLVPRVIRMVARLQSPETLLLASAGVCFGLAMIAHHVGYSVALGAFLAGSLVSESGEVEKIEHLIRPIRDLFAAIFFVAVGMILDPKILVEHWLPVLTLVVVVLVGQSMSVALGALVSGKSIRSSVKSGMSLAQIGEFSFIIAGLAVAVGAAREFIYPVAIAVSAVTTFLTPWMIRGSDSVAVFVDHRLPKPILTFLSLYGSWLERLRASRSMTRRSSSPIGRLIILLLVDAMAIVGLIVGSSKLSDSVVGLLHSNFLVPHSVGVWIVILGTLALLTPFLLGLSRISRSLGTIAVAAIVSQFPGLERDVGSGFLHGTLRVTAQLMIILVVSVPIFAMTQPFIPVLYGAPFLALLIVAVGLALVRTARDLQEHVAAGTEVIVEVLQKQLQRAHSPSPETTHPMLLQFGPITPLRLEIGSVAIGRTLSELDLRGRSGATVITIVRGDEGISPTGQEALDAGDVLALAGTKDAIAVATSLLTEGLGPLEQGRQP